jgi:hypothetical protein
MTNDPTTTATTANTMKNVVTKASWSCSSDWLSAVACAPVRTSVWPLAAAPALEPGPERVARMSDATWDWLTPGRATTSMLSSLPGSPTRFWASSVVNSTQLAPAGLSADPKPAMPTRSNVFTPALVWTRTWSPTWKPAVLAVAASTTISSAARGPRPERRSKGLRSAFSCQLPPIVGGPKVELPMASPWRSRIRAAPTTLPSAAATDGTAATSSSVPASILARVFWSNWSIVRSDRTTASVPL